MMEPVGSRTPEETVYFSLFTEKDNKHVTVLKELVHISF